MTGGLLPGPPIGIRLANLRLPCQSVLRRTATLMDRPPNGAPRRPLPRLLGSMTIGVPELLIVLAIVLVLFGGRKLPGLGRGIGSGLREFKDSLKGGDRE